MSFQLPENGKEWKWRVIERLPARTPDRFLLQALFGFYPGATPFIQAFQQCRQIDSLFFQPVYEFIAEHVLLLKAVQQVTEIVGFWFVRIPYIAPRDRNRSKRAFPFKRRSPCCFTACTHSDVEDALHLEWIGSGKLPLWIAAEWDKLRNPIRSHYLGPGACISPKRRIIFVQRSDQVNDGIHLETRLLDVRREDQAGIDVRDKLIRQRRVLHSRYRCSALQFQYCMPLPGMASG